MDGLWERWFLVARRARTWKLSERLNLLFSGGRDIVGDTHAMAYIGLQLLTK